VVGTSGTDIPKAVTGEDICGEGDPFSDVPPALVLRPTGSPSLLPKKVSQQITYTEQGAVGCGKEGLVGFHDTCHSVCQSSNGKATRRSSSSG
jgi:hypothetical protein